MKVVLDNNESLCWTCQNTSDSKCEFFKNKGNVVPDYSTKTIYKQLPDSHMGLSENQAVIRNCKNYIPCPEFVRTCKYCGEEYVLQSIHDDKTDGGFCYDCHVKRKKTYKIQRPNQKQPAVVKEKKCGYCGKKFAPNSNSQVYCCKECKKAADAKNSRKRQQQKSARRKSETARKKWEFEQTKGKLEAQAQNLLKETTQKYNKDVAEVKQLYKEQKEEFRQKARAYYDALDISMEQSLAKLEEKFVLAKADIEEQLEISVAKAKEEIYQKGDKTNE